MSDIQIVESKVEIKEGENYTKYVGTKEELIDAGVAFDEMFPVWPKRVKYFIGPNIPNEQQWHINRIRGARFELTKRHDRRAAKSKLMPNSWNPQNFRHEEAERVNVLFSLFMDKLNGHYELSAYGSTTHKISNADLDKLIALRHQVISTIMNAKVEGFGRRGNLQIVRSLQSSVS